MKNKHRVIDIVMVILLPILMAYSLIGEMYHEIIGTLMFLLFIYHNYLNRNFWKRLFKGKYNLQRFFRTLLNIMLTISVLLMILSGISMSKYIYKFLPHIISSASARTIHMVISYWSFILMSIHTGMHLIFIDKYNTHLKRFLMITGVLYGGYAFIKRNIPVYMFYKVPFVYFDHSESIIYFFIDYIMIMWLFAFLGYMLIKVLNSISKTSYNS